MRDINGKTINRIRRTKTEREMILNKTNGHCAYCGCELDLNTVQLDHIYPLYLGGEDTLSNLMPACRSCNHYKSTFTIEKFRDNLATLQQRMKQNNSNYNTMLRYNLIKENHEPIIFYFEKMEYINGKTLNIYNKGECIDESGK